MWSVISWSSSRQRGPKVSQALLGLILQIGGRKSWSADERTRFLVAFERALDYTIAVEPIGGGVVPSEDTAPPTMSDAVSPNYGLSADIPADFSVIEPLPREEIARRYPSLDKPAD